MAGGRVLEGVGLGLAGVFSAVPVLFVILKWAGALYLVLMAIKIARSSAIAEAGSRGRPMTLLQAAGFQWVNPKAWIIVISACATYGIPSDYAFSITVVALVLTVTTMPSIAIWVLFGSALRRTLSDPRKLAVFNYTMAALLIGSLYPIFTE